MRKWDFNEYSSCASKIRHETQSSAQRQASHTGHGQAYRCPFCKGWHIGNRREISRRDLGREKGH